MSPDGRSRRPFPGHRAGESRSLDRPKTMQRQDEFLEVHEVQPSQEFRIKLCLEIEAKLSRTMEDTVKK